MKNVKYVYYKTKKSMLRYEYLEMLEVVFQKNVQIFSFLIYLTIIRPIHKYLPI